MIQITEAQLEQLVTGIFAWLKNKLAGHTILVTLVNMVGTEATAEVPVLYAYLRQIGVIA